MATTIVDATLTVTVSESVSLNGYEQGSSNTLTLPNIDEVVKRIVTISTTETGLLGFHDGTLIAAGYLAGQFDEATVRYIRITNKDDTNHVTLIFKCDGNHEFAVKVDGGHSFIYCCDTLGGGGVVNTMDASASALSVALANLIDITAQANTASCDLEVFVAST
jgi:hypothetical protein